MNDILTYRNEVYRKLVHILSSVIPLTFYYLNNKDLLPLFIICSLILVLFDFLRCNVNYFQFIANLLFKNIIRKMELNSISGASYVLIGCALTLSIFNLKIAIISLFILSISDSIAAIIGIRYGKTKLLNKSLEGTFGFFCSTAIIITLSTNLSLMNLTLTAIIISFIELFSNKFINDNLSIPLSSAIALTILGVA